MNYKEYKKELEMIDNTATAAREKLNQEYLKEALLVGTYVIYKLRDFYKIWKIEKAYVSSLTDGIAYHISNKSGKLTYNIAASDFEYVNQDFEIVKNYLKNLEIKKLELALSDESEF